jgi:hypothetical protein
MAPPPISNQIADQYIIVLNVTTDMALHVGQLQAFMSTNQNCMIVKKSIVLQVDQPLFKFYSGKLDALALAFISNSPGVTSIQRDETRKMDDPPSSSDYSIAGLTGKSGRGIRRRRVGTAW